MFELVATDKTEHLRPSVLVCADDREAGIGVACRVNSCELVAQGAHRVQMGDVDDFDITIHLRREKKSFGQEYLCERKGTEGSGVRHR
jgi:hypothetical protein